MDKKINIQVPISKCDKEILDYAITEKLGLSINSAVIMFLKKVIEEKGIPFDITCPHPNDETLEAIREAQYLDENDSILFETREELVDYLNSIINESEDDD